MTMSGIASISHTVERAAYLRTSRIAACALAVSAPFLSGAAGPTSDFKQRVLAAHNHARASAGIRPLIWSPDLATSAQARADRLASTGDFEHSSDSTADPEGENIRAGMKGNFVAEAIVEDWIREKRYFKPGIFPNNSVTGKISDVIHYTQVMWRDTSRVGCAVATGKREAVMVCRYASAGNYLGERPF